MQKHTVLYSCHRDSLSLLPTQQTDSIFYLIRSLWTLVGRSRPFQRLDCVVRLSPHWTSLSLQRVVDECEECLGEGPLDFRIVQEKIALS